MSGFKAKMHQIRYPLGLRPRPRWESLQRSPDIAVLRPNATSKAEEGKGTKGGEGKEEGKEI